MMQTLLRARHALLRHHQANASIGALMTKSVRYGLELATAPFHLFGVNQVGEGVRTEGRPRIDNEGFMAIGRGTLLRSINVAVELATGPEGRLVIGDDVRLNYGVSIGCLQQIDIGDRCRIGPYVMIVDSDFHDVYDRRVRPAPRPVRLASDVWVGAKASILPGVTIGRGAIVGTGAVVLHDVPAFTIVAGVPARPIRTLDPQRFVFPNLRLQPTEP